MLKKAALTMALVLFTFAPTQAQLRVNRKSNFVGKFLILSRLVDLSKSGSEKVSLDAMNRLREVIFRSPNLIENGYSERVSLAGLIEDMNYDVDRIFEGIKNLESTIQTGNLLNQADLEVINAIKSMIIVEIKMILSSNRFQAHNEELTSIYESYRDEANRQKPDDRRHKRLQVAGNVLGALDLSWYIYAEQVQWLMATAFRLECINFGLPQTKQMQFAPEINVSQPPRMYVPGQPEDYLLSGD